MPLVSVIMLSYNHEAYLSEAIESVLQQTVQDFELIIIDDNSDDDSVPLIKKYQTRDKRIKTIFQGTNQGIPRNTNEGFGAAKGKYITFIDSDDVWMPEKLQKQLDVLASDENLVVWSEGLIIDAHNVPTGKTFTQIFESELREKSGNIFEDLMKGNHILGSSLIFKRQNLNNIRANENLRYLNDFQFNVDMARFYDFWFIQEPLVYYRMHGDNTYDRDCEGHFLDYPKVGLYFLEKYGDDIQNEIRTHIFSDSTNNLQRVISRREERIDAVTSYARSLEDIIHKKDAEITSVTSYARSLEDIIHKKDAEITSVTSYARSLEEQITVMKSSFFTWLHMRKDS
jgi:glycosyltransferase involved in cell wall biosynthesis